MSREEESLGFTITEKFFALLIMTIGVILVYNTVSSPNLTYPILFFVGGLTLILLGFFIILAKAR